MSQNVIVGTLGQIQGGLYGGATPIAYEEGATNGFGVRMTSVRQYHNWFTQAFVSAGDDETYFKSGHSMVVSVSTLTKSPGPSTFTFKLMAAGTYNTDIDAMFDRIFALPFDSAVAGGSTYGGFTQPYVYLILQHEVDRAAVGVQKLYGTDTAADYIAAWQLLWTRCGLRATAAGKPRSRVRFCWDITSFNITRSDPYYPGAGFVDIIGVDPYTGPTSPQSFSALTSSIWSYAAAKGKPVGFCEINLLHTADSSTAAAWWTDAATQINAQAVKVEFLNVWIASTSFGSTYSQYGINKLSAADVNGHSNPLIHAAIGAMITNLGGNAIISSVGQAKAAAPTGLAGSSSTDGTQETLTWSANAGGDNVTSWNVYRATDWVTQGGVKIGSVATATPRSFTDTGRTAGTKYSYWVSAVNSAGEGPLSVAPTQIQTNIPSPTNHSPTISAAGAVVETASPQNVDFAATASDPDSNPITYTWTVLDGAGVVVDSFNGASATRSYSTQGPYTWTLVVADNGTPPLTVSAGGAFSIVLNPTQTPLLGYDLSAFQPGQFVEGLGKAIIPIVSDLDTRVGGLINAVGELGELLGSCGQTFDPSLGSASNTANLVSGGIIYAKCKCRGTTLSAISTITIQAQVGTGSLLAVCDVNGNIVTVDGTGAGTPALYSGTNVDAWLTHAAGFTSYTLDTAISGLSSGSDLTFIVFSPPTTVTTYAHLLGAPGPNNAALANGVSTLPLFGSATGQTTIPSPAPIGNPASTGAYVAAPKALFILYS